MLIVHDNIHLANPISEEIWQTYQSHLPQKQAHSPSTREPNQTEDIIKNEIRGRTGKSVV